MKLRHLKSLFENSRLPNFFGSIPALVLRQPHPMFRFCSHENPDKALAKLGIKCFVYERSKKHFNKFRASAREIDKNKKLINSPLSFKLFYIGFSLLCISFSAYGMDLVETSKIFEQERRNEIQSAISSIENSTFQNVKMAKSNTSNTVPSIFQDVGILAKNIDNATDDQLKAIGQLREKNYTLAGLLIGHHLANTTPKDREQFNLNCAKISKKIPNFPTPPPEEPEVFDDILRILGARGHRIPQQTNPLEQKLSTFKQSKEDIKRLSEDDVVKKIEELKDLIAKKTIEPTLDIVGAQNLFLIYIDDLLWRSPILVDDVIKTNCFTNLARAINALNEAYEILGIDDNFKQKIYTKKISFINDINRALRILIAQIKNQQGIFQDLLATKTAVETYYFPPEYATNQNDPLYESKETIRFELTAIEKQRKHIHNLFEMLDEFNKSTRDAQNAMPYQKLYKLRESWISYATEQESFLKELEEDRCNVNFAAYIRQDDLEEHKKAYKEFVRQQSGALATLNEIMLTKQPLKKNPMMPEQLEAELQKVSAKIKNEQYDGLSEKDLTSLVLKLHKIIREQTDPTARQHLINEYVPKTTEINRFIRKKEAIMHSINKLDDFISYEHAGYEQIIRSIIHLSNHAEEIKYTGSEGLEKIKKFKDKDRFNLLFNGKIEIANPQMRMEFQEACKKIHSVVPEFPLLTEIPPEQKPFSPIRIHTTPSTVKPESPQNMPIPVIPKSLSQQGTHPIAPPTIPKTPTPVAKAPTALLAASTETESIPMIEQSTPLIPPAATETTPPSSTQSWFSRIANGFYNLFSQIWNWRWNW
jgi:hypothetical protein